MLCHYFESTFAFAGNSLGHTSFTCSFSACHKLGGCKRIKGCEHVPLLPCYVWLLEGDKFCVLTKSALKKHVFYRFFSSSFFIYVSTVCLETCAGTCMHHRFRPPSLSGNIRKFKLRGYPAKYGTWRPKMAQVFLFCFFPSFSFAGITGWGSLPWLSGWPCRCPARPRHHAGLTWGRFHCSHHAAAGILISWSGHFLR